MFDDSCSFVPLGVRLFKKSYLKLNAPLFHTVQHPYFEKVKRPVVALYEHGWFLGSLIRDEALTFPSYCLLFDQFLAVVAKMTHFTTLDTHFLSLHTFFRIQLAPSERCNESPLVATTAVYAVRRRNLEVLRDIKRLFNVRNNLLIRFWKLRFTFLFVINVGKYVVGAIYANIFITELRSSLLHSQWHRLQGKVDSASGRRHFE